MSALRNLLFRWAFVIGAACVTTSCSTAQYTVKANKAADFAGHITRVTVWSGIGTVPLLSQTHALGMSDTFSNFFMEALKTDFSNNSVSADIHSFSSGTDKLEDLIRFEKGFAPEYRLVIAVPEYHTITSHGITNMLDMKLDISLYTVKDSRRVWRSELMLDGGLIPGLTWRETGAQNLAERLTNLLKQDKLI
jgi:hypothetical protein